MKQLIAAIIGSSRRRFVIFCAASGITAVVGTAGIVHGMTYLYHREIAQANASASTTVAVAAEKPFFAQIIDAFEGLISAVTPSGGGGFTEIARIPEGAPLPVLAPAKKRSKRSATQAAAQNAASPPSAPDPAQPELIGAADTSSPPAVKAVASPSKASVVSTADALAGTAAKPKPPLWRHVNNAIADASPEQTSSTPVPQKCAYATVAQPSHSKLILNEIAWAGTDVSSNNEWFELKNISGNELDVSNWQIVDKGDQIHVTFAAQTHVPAAGLVLLERTDDNSVPGVPADLTYVGALGNTDEGLRLFDSGCVLVDEAVAAPNWPAGDAVTKKSMERASDFSWYTYTGDGASGIFGTPRGENSTPSASSNGAQMADSSAQSTSSTDSGLTSPAPSATVPSSAATHIVISEIQAGVSGASTNEFIELYNPTGAGVDLTGWTLKKKTSSGTENILVASSRLQGKSIPAHGFFLFANDGGYTGAVAADVIYPHSYEIAYTNNSLALYDGSNAKIDEVSWTSINAGASIERKAVQGGACVSAQGAGEPLGNACDTDLASDFEPRAVPNPQNSGSAAEVGS